MQAKRFLYDKISLNVLAKDIANAREIYDVTEGHVIIGLLSANYDSTEEAILDMQAFDRELDGAVSVGLGGGDPRQANMVVDIVGTYKPEHVNQVFTHVGRAREALAFEMSWVNALVSPSERIGYINIATGPRSSGAETAEVPIKTALEMVRDMGGNSLKLFPMKGLATKEAYEEVARVCAEENFALEPTGGIDLNNFQEIIEIALAAGVPRVIPHVYSSIIDPATGETRIDDVKKLYEIMKDVTQKYR